MMQLQNFVLPHSFTPPKENKTAFVHYVSSSPLIETFRQYTNERTDSSAADLCKNHQKGMKTPSSMYAGARYYNRSRRRRRIKPPNEIEVLVWKNVALGASALYAEVV